MVGKDGTANMIYNNAVKMAIDEDGNRKDMYEMMYRNKEGKHDAEVKEYEWYRRLKAYADENDENLGDVLDNIVTTVMDESGEPEVRFKSSIGL